jgi:nicotinamide-nucleotide amidase
LDSNYQDFRNEVFAFGGSLVDKSAQDVVQLLREKNLRISFAESCTGGMASSAITSVEGASEVLDMSMTTYANRAKVEYTDVTDEILDTYGAVSSQTAMLMASGIRKRSKADIGVGITGIAGPGGGSPEKPVGTVYIAVDFGRDNIKVKHFVFAGKTPENNRAVIREKTVIQALSMVKDELGNV